MIAVQDGLHLSYRVPPLLNLAVSRPPGNPNSGASEAPYPSYAVVAEVPMLAIEPRPDVSWARPTPIGPSSIVDAGRVASQARISYAIEFAPTVRTSLIAAKLTERSLAKDLTGTVEGIRGQSEL
jgi:hypothetical protein